MEKSDIKIPQFKIGQKVWIIESELGGTDFIKCEIISSHLGTTDEDDDGDEPYPYDDYDVQNIQTGTIWDFVNAEDIYKTKKEAQEDY